MKFIRAPIGGVYVLELEHKRDERGFFSRLWCARELAEHGLNPTVAQVNVAHNARRGTIRGMHYQVAPHEEAKLITCTRGAIFDVALDLRPDSPTRLQWFGIELTADSGRMLYVPEGFAHGYQVLTDDSQVFYLSSEFYAPEAERGVRWDDPAFSIAWPITDDVVLSPKDASWEDHLISARP